MPELPEVETMRRGLYPIIGRRIAAIVQPPCHCRPISISPPLSKIQAALVDQRIEAVERVGKRVLLLTGQWALVLQPKMTGLVAFADVPSVEHIRLIIQLAGRPKLQVLFWDRRGLGTVELLDRTEIQNKLISGRLGPDALAITSEDFYQRLHQTRRPIKVALLDQKLVAGVGNLYASEMLHVAQIHPATPANELRPADCKKLYAAMLDILQTAIEYEGSTLSDGTYRNALNKSGGYQNHHRVYDRKGQLCPTCSQALIERMVQAQRSTFFCPRCQKLRTHASRR